jgi:UDP-N-acetylglucosamine--N-acetylmuramyl-(pentapeptide) pyrophosphoryl-undecaprenol N-acetylglucosamine transferase
VKNVLLVCAAGGHLRQLHQLYTRMGFGDAHIRWVTYRSGLSASLLADDDVVYATYAHPRDARNIARNQSLAWQMLRTREWDFVISTGSSLAVNFLPLGRMLGASAHYIESAARVTGPSMTGRLLAKAPGVHRYCQYKSWATNGWAYAGSVFDSYESEPVNPGGAIPTIRRAVVTVGTSESHGYRRLIEAALPLLDGVEVLWQTGTTDVTGLPIISTPTLPLDELTAAIAEADVVISHAGTGSALTSLGQGRCPVLVPRASVYGEHVDDHQKEIAHMLAQRGLAVEAAPESLSEAHLVRAAAMRVRESPSPPPFRLSS